MPRSQRRRFLRDENAQWNQEFRRGTSQGCLHEITEQPSPIIPACFSFGMKSATGCDLDHNLEPAIDGRLELMVQIDSNNEIRSCPLYSTSSIANTAVPASQKCEGNF
jgi:hypothetical protein